MFDDAQFKNELSYCLNKVNFCKCDVCFKLKVQGERCATRLQTVANSIAWMARSLSFDDTFISPFAESAFANGIDTIGKSTFVENSLRIYSLLQMSRQYFGDTIIRSTNKFVRFCKRWRNYCLISLFRIYKYALESCH